jgi:hypothetical protein
MLRPDWKPVETVQKKLRVTRVENKARHVDALDLEENLPMCLGASENIDLSKIKRAKIYQATVQIYETEFTPELEQQVFESAMGDLTRLKALQAMKASGAKPRKYELIAIKH